MQNLKPLARSIAEQAGLSLTWSETPKTGFLVTWLSVQSNFIRAVSKILQVWVLKVTGIFLF